MANYVFNPSDHAVGTNIETLGWTRRFVINADTWKIAEPVAGTKTLRFTKASASVARSAISWDQLDADAARADIECLAVFRGRETTANDCSIRLMARGSGSASAENCVYVGTTIGSNLNYILGQFGAGTSTTHDSATLLSGQNFRNSDTWLAHRSRINGGDLLWKFWIPADPANPTADEPGTWSRDEFSVTTVNGPGWVGLIRQTHGDHEYLMLAFATGGDTASFSASPDVTAPTLSDPTGTATGSTTASGSVTTSEGNGTLYWRATANATETVETVKVGSSQAVSAVGAQAVSLTGLTASTTYYLHFVHRDAAGNDSSVASSASFTTSAPAAEPPAGTVTIGTITKTHETASVPYSYSASDASGFEYRIDGGTPVAAGASPIDLAGLAAATAYTIEVRATNSAGAGAWSAPGSFTTDAAPVVGGTITIGPLWNNTEYSRAVNETGITAHVYALSGALVVSLTGQTTDANGMMVLSDSAIIAGTQYRVVIVLASGDQGLARETAA